MNVLHPLQQRVFDCIQQHRLVRPGDHVLVAVSGGPDSVALLHVLAALRNRLSPLQLTTLHLDHQLRGEASEQDARFVRELAERLGIPCYCAHADVLGHQREHRVSLEMAARTCRHHFFQEAREVLQAQAIALGHSADDQAEEVLLRLFRGTGPAGLAGMRVKAAAGIIRPLLNITRADLLDYLQEVHLAYRTDASNLDPCCQRNILRLQVFPVLRAHFHPRQVETLCRHARLVRDEEDYWLELVGNHWQEVCLAEGPTQVDMSAARLRELPAALQRRLLRLAVEKLRGNLQRIYAVHIEALRQLLAAHPSRKALHLPGKLRALRVADTLRCSKGMADWPRPLPAQLITAPGRYELPGFSLELRLADWMPAEKGMGQGPAASPNVALMDAAALRWPLVVRSWQAGDRFQPLGLKGSKKLQDFFTDAKIPREERLTIPLLCDQDKICWVVGQRLDERMKVTSETKTVLVAVCNRR